MNIHTKDFNGFLDLSTDIKDVRAQARGVAWALPDPPRGRQPRGLRGQGLPWAGRAQNEKEEGGSAQRGADNAENQL